MATLQQRRADAEGRIVEHGSGPDALLTYEYPGILVLHHAHERGDIGIDDGFNAVPDWASRSFGVVTYDGAWGDTDDARGYTVIPVDREMDDETERESLADSFAEIDATGDVAVHLPAGVVLLVTRGHMFAYAAGAYGDGGACVGITHRAPADVEGECDALACPLADGRGDVDGIIDDVDVYALQRT